MDDDSDERDDMYVFEGTNYRQGPSTLDHKAFDELLDGNFGG